MKGPDRPHTMQTTTPPLARTAQGAATSVAPSCAVSGECFSARVGNSTWSCEDWSVTHRSSRSRYSP